MTKVLIIGLGRIGFYHFESLFKSKNNFKLDCVEISRERNKKINIYIQKYKKKNNVRILNSLNKINKKYDLLIHCTTSDVRFTTLQKILKISKFKYAILEKNLTGSLLELNKFKTIQKKFKKCWVNTFRHETTLWKKLKKKVKNQNISSVEIKGVGGLACNAIHYIDLVASWKKKLPTNIQITNFKKWYKSSRIGFYDFYGELRVKFPDNSNLSIISREDYEEWKCTIYDQNKKWVLIERDGYFFSEKVKTKGKFELQSEITVKVVNKIIKYGSCNLPELDWSIKCYTILLNVLLKHWNKYFKKSVRRIPIT